VTFSFITETRGILLSSGGAALLVESHAVEKPSAVDAPLGLPHLGAVVEGASAMRSSRRITLSRVFFVAPHSIFRCDRLAF